MTDGPSILVADDESESLGLLTRILADEGYRVRSANSGQLALVSVEAWLPQLILLDIRMPGIGGLEVCRRLKAAERTRDVPIMFISAAADLEERVAGLGLGAVDFITKPFQREELLARVRTHLELGRLRAGLEKQVSERTIELRSTIERLRESEERFRNMADTAPVMIWVTGPDRLATFFNQGYLSFTGSTLDQALGDGWSANVHPDDREHCYTRYSEAFDTRRRYQTECRLRRSDGEYRWVLATGAPRFESGGVFVGFIGSCLDITDIKHAYEKDLGKQRLEAVGMLAGGIAHDFNNLLGGVLAHSELALAELANGSQPVNELRRIRDAATRGAEIVRQLLAYAGEEAEELELVDVPGIVEDMLELLKVSVSKQVTVETDFGKQLPRVRANPSQIRQVVMNLFYNASEAIGDRAGVIRVTVMRVTVGPGSLPGTHEPVPAGEYLQLEVSDTGRGMNPETQARVLDAFFTTKTAGTHGLGLAVVQGIVQRLHGTIRLSSTPGKGTTFQILLPFDEQVAEAVHGTIPSANANVTMAFRGATILLVEDEDVLRDAIAKTLRKRGLLVLEASDGTAALDVIRSGKTDIDLLLMDITLPGASSREVYEEAKHLRPNLPVIVTSAHSRATAASSLATSVDDFIRKPFNLSDLIDKVRQVLSRESRASGLP